MTLEVPNIPLNFQGAAAPKLIGIWAIDRPTLIAVARGYVQDGSAPFIEVVLPCGNIRRWLTEDAVPEQSIECRCGDLPNVTQHWFIKYQDEPAA